MFFKSIFDRKEISVNKKLPVNGNNEDTNNVIGENKDNNNNQSSICLNKMQRRNELAVTAVQLTPLWEHILRTRRLPETICPVAMYAEFHERLQDPEWQVRQHALRVLVDVLVVMGAKADKHSMHFLIDLIKNLGHQAPTVRKGALDCLRVYLSETAMPETVMLQILDTGLSKQQTYDERLSCGVLLSLPPLLQSILHTPQRNFIVKHTLERLMQRLQQQQSQQEVTLKVLAKICQLLGVEEFENILDDVEVDGHDGVSLFNYMCSLYGIFNKPCRADGSVNAGAWRALPQEHTWRNSNIVQESEAVVMPENGKVIMETEIKINDDTLTMRILEAETETEESGSPIIDATELVCRPLSGTQCQRNMNAGILEIISDSEVDEYVQNESLLSTPYRGLKRVTFGGEVVKMRTPDSDAPSSVNNVETKTTDSINPSTTLLNSKDSKPLEGQPADNISSVKEDKKMTALTLEIPSDNTKPLTHGNSAQSPRRSNSFSKEQGTPTTYSNNSFASPKREVSHSPVYRSCSISPAGSNSVSPKVPHKEIEVMHNLQRDCDPSPRSVRRGESAATNPVTPPTATPAMAVEPPATQNNWEDLDIVNYKTIMDLRSGDWRNRLQGIAQLQLALSASSNLVRVQPYLDSLLRTLLSSERNFEVAELKRELLTNLISRLPLDNLEDRTQQILLGLCRQGNAGANRVCKALMQRLPAGTIVAKLTAPDYLHGKSSKFRDHALQMSIYALMSFPGTCFDINILAAQVTYAALNRKRRVRQAALEVFAVLADICSVDQILQIIAEITDGIESGSALLTAVKARLSRLQLPTITPDGAVLYIFHKIDPTSTQRFGADMNWITQGEGSASPNAVKRRRLHMAHKKRIAQNNMDGETSNGTYHSYRTDDSLHRHSFHSPPEALDMPRSSNDFFQKKNYGPSANFLERQLVAKACSETSMDGRSTDSTTTTCSSGSGSGSGSFIQLTSCKGGINRRLVRQNSRFPVMRQHTDFISNFMRNMQRTPYPYSFEASKSVKQNNDLQKSQKQQITNKSTNLVHQNWIDNGSQLQATKCKVKSIKKQEYGSQSEMKTSNQDAAKCKADVEPFNELTTSTSVAGSPQINNRIDGGSPLSIKSTSYSQKSTASAKSNSNQSETVKQAANQLNVRNDIEPLSLEQQFGDLVVDDMEEETEPTSQEPILKRNESVNSLHSKTESIKTQLEDATPQMSRAQSTKSLAIEEEIESSNSFVVVEDLQQALESTIFESSTEKQMSDLETNSDALLASASQVSPSKKSDIENVDRHMHSRSISMDSLYGRRNVSKQGPLDTSTSTMENSSPTPCANVEKCRLPAKSQHIPLQQKSKTSYLLRGQRRVSPVKQAIKMSPTELFPPNMTRFEKPREALAKTFDQLDSNNWEVNVTGLKCMVRLIRYHSDFLDSHMHMTCIQLTRSVRNLRSQVARAACQAATELFTLKCKSLEIECDDLVCALLHRSADTNRFLRADATRALESMVDHLQPSKVLNILTSKGAQHQNAIVRTTTAKLLFRLVERLGCDRVYSMNRENRDKFFMVGANLLLEGSLETRSYAKSLFRALSEHSSYQRLILEVIPSRTYRNVEKTLKSIVR